jgi:hypothetical protein
MKLKTKRTRLLIKKYLFYIVVCTASFLLGSLIIDVVDLIGEKRDEKRLAQKGEYLTDNLRTRILDNGKVEIFKPQLNKVVGCYDMVVAQDYGSSICEMLLNSCMGSVLVRNEGLYGYIDPVTGEVIMEPQFIMAWDSDPISGIAACINDELKLGFVNIETKQMVIPFQFDIDSTYLDPGWLNGYRYFDFIFRNGLSLVPGPNGKVGIINEAGEIVVPIEYDEIEVKNYGELSHSWDELWYSETMSSVVQRDYRDDYCFDETIILMKKDSTGVARYGVFDKNGVINIPVEYDRIAFCDSYDKVMILCQEDGILKGVDEEGNLMNDFCFNYDCAFGDCVSVLMDPEDKPSPYIQYMTLNGYAVMDNKFRVVIAPDDYWGIQYLGHGLFACARSEDYSIILKDNDNL